MFSKKTREKGRVAFANGLTLEDNPYRYASRKHMAKAAWWDAGWTAAKNEFIVKTARDLAKTGK